MLERKKILLLLLLNSIFTYSVEVISTQDLSLDIGVEVKSGYKYQVTEYPGISSFNLYSADLEIDSEVYNRLDLSLTLDFSEFDDGVLSSEVLKNAYSQYRFHNYFKLRFGQFKSGFGGEGSLGSSVPHLKGSEATDNLAPGRVRGVQLSGSKILNTLSYKIGFFNSGDYTEKGNSDGHHIGTAKLEYKLKKKKCYEFKTGYSFAYGTHETLTQGLFILYKKRLGKDFRLYLFTEYMEQRFYNYYWNCSIFASTGLRFKDIELALNCEYYDDIIGHDGPKDKINPGTGVNFYAIDDNCMFRLHYEFDYLFSSPPNRTDRFADHEISLIMEARI